MLCKCAQSIFILSIPAALLDDEILYMTFEFYKLHSIYGILLGI